jgi:hypothetical protein
MFNNADMSDLVLIDFGDSEMKKDIKSDEKKVDTQFLYNLLKYSAKLNEEFGLFSEKNKKN